MKKQTMSKKACGGKATMKMAAGGAAKERLGMYEEPKQMKGKKKK